MYATTVLLLALELESPRPRQGYFIAIGLLNAGAVHVREDGDELGTYQGGLFDLRLGQMLTPCVGLGLDFHSGSATGDDQLAVLAGLGVTAQWEFATNIALHAAIGLGVVSLDDTEMEDEPSRGKAGSGYTLGLSWDWFPWADDDQSGGWAVTPMLQMRAVPGSDVSSVAVFLGVDIVWWSGLPRNQLDLPESEAYR